MLKYDVSYDFWGVELQPCVEKFFGRRFGRFWPILAKFGKFSKIIIFMKKSIVLYVFGVGNSKFGVENFFWPLVWPV